MSKRPNIPRLPINESQQSQSTPNLRPLTARERESSTSQPTILRSNSARDLPTSARRLNTPAGEIPSFLEYNKSIKGRILKCKNDNHDKIIGVEMECNGFKQIYFIRYFEDETTEPVFKVLKPGYYVSNPRATLGESRTSMYDLTEVEHFPNKNEQNIVNPQIPVGHIKYETIQRLFQIQPASPSAPPPPAPTTPRPWKG
jgi:hypothetical protein